MLLSFVLFIFSIQAYSAEPTEPVNCELLISRFQAQMDNQIKPEFGCPAPKLRIEKSADDQGPFFSIKSCTTKKRIEVCIPMTLSLARETGHGAYPELSEILGAKREIRFLASCEIKEGSCRKLLAGFKPENFVDRPSYIYSEKMSPDSSQIGQLGLKQLSEITVRTSGKIRVPAERLVELLRSADLNDSSKQGVLIQGYKKLKRALMKSQADVDSVNKCQFEASLKKLLDKEAVAADFFQIGLNPTGSKSYCGGPLASRLEKMLLMDTLYNPNQLVESVSQTVNEGLKKAQPGIRKEFEKGAK